MRLGRQSICCFQDLFDDCLTVQQTEYDLNAANEQLAVQQATLINLVVQQQLTVQATYEATYVHI